MASRFNPTALKLIEDALSEAFYSHRDFDSFIRRCDIDERLLADARRKAEARKGNYERAPKRFIAQELIQLIESKGDQGVHLLTSIFDALVRGTFSDATSKGKDALNSLKTQFERDREQRLSEEKAKREWKAEREQAAARSSESTAIARDRELARLHALFLEMHGASDKHKRGRAFELLVVDLLKAEQLSPRHSIERVGEQIDASFEFGPHTYLVEARWKAAPSEPKDLRDFYGKCQGVHVDVRGLFISVQGYTTGCSDSLKKLGELRIVLLDGSHLMGVLSGAIGLHDLLKKLIRKACDEGAPYVPLSSL